MKLALLSLLSLTCSALNIPFYSRKNVNARVSSPFVDFVAPTVRHNQSRRCRPKTTTTSAAHLPGY